MAHVYKPTWTTKIPEHAISCTVRGQPAVRWKGRGGVKVGVVSAPGRCRVESAKWYVSYRDAGGQDQHVPGYADKGATEALMAKLVQQAARIASGLLPPEAVKPRVTLAKLLDRWRDYLTAHGGTEKHAVTQRLRVEKICSAAGAERPADLTPAAVIRAVAKVKRETDLSARTAGHYLGAVKAFTRWLCVSEKYEPVDHLSGVSRSVDDTDPRLVRRVLTADQFAAFIRATRVGEVSYGLTGSERAALYLTAASTGLRASELASLTRSAFTTTTVTVKAAYAKGRRTDELPVSDDLATALLPILAERTSAEPVWPDRSHNLWAKWWNDGAKMVAKDLAAAGIPRVDESGRVFDFHALRSQFITDLGHAGVNLARAQKLARHSTPALTSKHYDRPDKADLAADVNKLKRDI